jgi:hypothetical protein
VISNVVSFDVVNPRALLNFEKVLAPFSLGGSQVTLSSHDLLNGPYSQSGYRSAYSLNEINVVYAPERNIRVRITLAGGAGGGTGSGQGGVSTFDYTFERNVEYVFQLASSVQSAGQPESEYLRGVYSGGFSSQFYRKSKLVAVCGGGGNSGFVGGANTRTLGGGRGGGVNVAGERGTGAPEVGAVGGAGGSYVAPGTFLNGSVIDFRSTVNPYIGGTINSFSNGIDVINRTGTPASNDFPGLTQLILVGEQILLGGGFRSQSFVAPNTAFISRGYKVGRPYGFKFNGGGTFQSANIGYGSGGGAGAIGGNAGSTAGGGGGSGYHDGSVSVVSTQLGGNPNPAGYIIIQAI